MNLKYLRWLVKSQSVLNASLLSQSTGACAAVLLSLSLFTSSLPAQAQDALDELEHLNDTPVTAPKGNPAQAPAANAPANPAPDQNANAATPTPTTPAPTTEDNYTAPTYSTVTPATKVNAAEDKDLTTLGKLSPFEDIAVIQPRYLPTTSRVELSPAIGMILNQAFFSNYILSLKVAYHFTEQYAAELNGFYLSTSQRQVTSDLLGTFQIATSNIVNAQSYYGGDFRWSPIYGKMGYMGKKIVYFDMFFVAGAGMMQTTAGSAVAFHVGTGQEYALTKAIAARWDLGYYFYNVQGGSFNDMHVTIGASFFVPEAKTR